MDFVGITDSSPLLRQALTVHRDLLTRMLSNVRATRPAIFVFILGGHKYPIPVSPQLAHEVVLLYVLTGADYTVLELAQQLLEQYQQHNSQTTKTLEMCIRDVRNAINDLNNTP